MEKPITPQDTIKNLLQEAQWALERHKEKEAKTLSIEEQRELFKKMEPSPSPTPNPDILKIKEGLTNWGKGTEPPISSMSAELLEAGKDLPHKYLPAALSLKETGGLRDSDRARLLNNPFGIGPGVKYENLSQAILGGVDKTGLKRRGLKGILANDRYKKYRETGNLEDFFEVYTPTSDKRNASLVDQVRTMQELLDYFK